MRCVNCIHCIDFKENYYVCNFLDEYNLIEECVANDDSMVCDFYEQDRNDNFTERS